MWPQLTYMALTMVSLGMSLQKSKTGSDAMLSLWAVFVIQTLLYFGGFYDCFFN